MNRAYDSTNTHTPTPPPADYLVEGVGFEPTKA
jgi:hypothetical protein